jgi:hypothetical protein
LGSMASAPRAMHVCNELGTCSMVGLVRRMALRLSTIRWAVAHEAVKILRGLDKKQTGHDLAFPEE